MAKRSIGIPLFPKKPILLPEKGPEEFTLNDYAEVFYGNAIDKVSESGMQLVYICESAKQHPLTLPRLIVLGSAWYAAQIAGAEYKGKKLALWVPHYHGLTMDGNSVDPLYGLKYRQSALFLYETVIIKHSPIIVTRDENLFDTVRDEVRTAKALGLDIFNHGDFKGMLRNLPTEEESRRIFDELVRSARPYLP